MALQWDLIQPTFDRPSDKPKLVRITVKSGVGIDPVDDIKNAVVNYANGLVDGEDGFIVGGNVSAFEIAAAVNDQVASIFVSKCEYRITNLHNRHH